MSYNPLAAPIMIIFRELIDAMKGSKLKVEKTKNNEEEDRLLQHYVPSDVASTIIQMTQIERNR